MLSVAPSHLANHYPSHLELDRIWSWNATVQQPLQGCVHDLIAEIAQRQPDVLAVCAWDGDFTYSQLNALADAVARRLLGLGISPKSNLPILFSKSRWTCVAMLGVIKAGCSAIALDATQPDARLRSIIQQARPSAIVSSAAHGARASLLANVPVLQLDDVMLATADPPEESWPQLPMVLPADIIYISFTSYVVINSPRLPREAIADLC
jgi:non-ribosomal peptide synthetase component F